MRSPSRSIRRAQLWGAFALLLLLASPALAAEDRCPLDLTTCLQQFDRMRQRPWMGVTFDTDSLGNRIVQGTEPGSPSQRAGIRPGDILQTIEGKPPGEWFAGKAGWIRGESGDVGVLRGGKQKVLRMRYEAIPEAVFARRIGVHMVEAHLAYMHDAHSEEQH